MRWHRRLARFLLTLPAPGVVPLRAGDVGGALRVGMAGLGGLAGLVAVLTWTPVFPPTAVALWLVFQGVLGLQQSRESTAVAPGRRNSRAVVWGLALLLFAPLPVTAVVVGLEFGIVPQTSDGALPGVRPGEWVLYRRGFAAPVLGDLALVECPDGEAMVARVVGLPGDTVRVQDSAVCTQAGCYPQLSFATLLPEEERPRTAVAEVVGDRYHVVIRQRARPATAGTIRHLTVGEDERALLPDNRDSRAMHGCPGTAAVPLTRVTGRPTHVLFSTDWSRIGVRLR